MNVRQTAQDRQTPDRIIAQIPVEAAAETAAARVQAETAVKTRIAVR